MSTVTVGNGSGFSICAQVKELVFNPGTGKEKHGTKEAKKQPVLTQKEKKAVKDVKKKEKSAVHPLITR